MIISSIFSGMNSKIIQLLQSHLCLLELCLLLFVVFLFFFSALKKLMPCISNFIKASFFSSRQFFTFQVLGLWTAIEGARTQTSLLVLSHCTNKLVCLMKELDMSYMKFECIRETELVICICDASQPENEQLCFVLADVHLSQSPAF